MGRLVVICALFSLGTLLLGACQGEYPLEPTICDRWCEATKEMQCSWYDPAGCVVGCEQQGVVLRECADEFNAALACYEQVEIPCNPDDEGWYFSGPYPCLVEQAKLTHCAELYDGYSFLF